LPLKHNIVPYLCKCTTDFTLYRFFGLTSLPGIEHQLLDAARNEIRVITLLPSYAWPDHPEQICCSLENVSLSEYTPLYNYFLGHCSSEFKDASYRDLGTLWRQLQRVIPPDDDEQEEDPLRHLPLVDELNLSSLRRFMWVDFAALSSAWYEPSLTEETIFTNGHVTEISGNLCQALRCLRDHFKRGLKLWVDALYINQKDVVKRNQQVRRMGGIYAKALNTIVWLSNERPDTIRTFSFMHELGTAHAQVAMVSQVLLRGEYNNSNDEIWIGLRWLLTRPYWKRLWIIQELSANTSSQTIICGKEEIQTDLFYISIEAMKRGFELVVENMISSL
jgi:hypothetical protein